MQASANKWGIGPINVTIIISHYLYEDLRFSQTFIVYGRLLPQVDYNETINQSISLNVTMLIYDENHNPTYGNNISIKLLNQTILYGYSEDYRFSTIIDTYGLPIGTYELEIIIENPYAEVLHKKILFNIVGNINMSIRCSALSYDGAYIQGNEIPVIINLLDAFDNPLSDASISALFYGRFYGFFSYGNGTYRGIISTEGVRGGSHQCFVIVEHYLLGTIEKNITLYVLGEPEIQMDIDKPIIQDTYHQVSIIVQDKYGYPMEDINVTVEIAGKVFEAKHSDSTSGLYTANISLFGLRHGTYKLTVNVTGKKYVGRTSSVDVYVDVKIPELRLSWASIGIMLLISFIASGIGLLIYYKLTRAVKYHRTRNIEKSIKILNITYLIVLIGFISTISLCYLSYIEGSYVVALGEVALSIVLILLLSALWIYRDINKNILIEKFERKVLILGMWHILVVPLLIYSIFAIGINIEWFAVHIVEDVICIAGYCTPKLLISLITTYMGSYAVIVINTYRESRKIVEKIEYMRKHETAEDVIRNEKKYNITKLTDSMRNKFLVFLVIIGTTIVSTTRLLQYYAIGLVVAIPLLVVFIIPYITAKIYEFLGRKIE